MNRNQPCTVVKVIRDQDVFYTIPWTPLRIADRHEIALRVPALAGLFEIFWEDEKKRLHLFSLEPAWYGGLRAKLAEKLDTDFEKNPWRRTILLNYRLHYRYVFLDSWDDVKDLMCIFLQIYQPHLGILSSSGRYKNIHIKEIP